MLGYTRLRNSPSVFSRPIQYCYEYAHRFHPNGTCSVSVVTRAKHARSEKKKNVHTVSLPPYMRFRAFLKQQGGRTNTTKLLNAIGGRREKKKIYWDDVETGRSYIFDHTKQMILPFHCMEKVIKAIWEDNIQVEKQEAELLTPRLRPIPNPSDEEEASSLGLVEKRPVVAVLGHIDHGKTTLVDALRDENTADREAGGITQAIGAWPVELSVDGGDKTIQTTFLDTPGHVHFYQMREDSARVATAALLVVACDEQRLGDQTIESINCLLDMDVPVVVAINKIDLKSAKPDRTRMLLEKNGVLTTKIGGTVPKVVDVSAKERLNLPNLEKAVVDAITKQGLWAFGECVPAEGIVIEAMNTRHKGALLRIVISAGVLRKRQAFTSGFVAGLVRTIYDESGKEQINEAWPGQVVYVSGLKGEGLVELPPLGEPFFVVKNREQADQLVDYKRIPHELSHYQVSGPPLTIESDEEGEEVGVDEIHEPEEEIQGLPLILKAESAGKLDALQAALVETNGVMTVRATLGPPQIRDIEIAASGDKIPVVCFGFKNVPSKIEKEAEKRGVPLIKSMVLHELVDEIKKLAKEEF